MLNLTTIKTPGVYVDEVPKFPPSVAQVETAIPAFIGYTSIAKKEADDDLIRKPTRISSLAEYVALYGGAPEQEFELTVEKSGTGTSTVWTPVSAKFTGKSVNYRMYHALRLFYANGGGPCYIVSVGKYKTNGSVSADEMGTNATATGGVDFIRKVDEVTLFVFPDANGLTTTASYYGLFDKGLKQSMELMDRFTIVDVKDGALKASVDAFRSATLTTGAEKYGAAYFPWLKTLYTHRTANGKITVKISGTADKKLDTILGGADKKFITNAFLSKMNEIFAKEKVMMPPSPAIAGAYAATDGSRGVWKAPANIGLADVIEPSQVISAEDQGDMNIHDTGKSVNAIRSFTGKGTLIWGARTLAGNDKEWRYVSVRRFFNMVEESVKKASGQFVFEPNDANTWIKVQAMIENYLNTLWRAGALQGAKPEHAYYVAVGLDKTMTPQDILDGFLIVEIGMAAVRPAEFIVLRFSHKLAES